MSTQSSAAGTPRPDKHAPSTLAFATQAVHASTRAPARCGHRW
ncbi:hypothetical protein [Streptomyces milbemycinicus]|uniref:Uncharacterized protein n=1 Tax=Streptomyces milbemycinicus TaxID=476552 RepID=A0ABW8M8R5_9ACTN